MFFTNLRQVTGVWKPKKIKGIKCKKDLVVIRGYVREDGEICVMFGMNGHMTTLKAMLAGYRKA